MAIVQEWSSPSRRDGSATKAAMTMMATSFVLPEKPPQSSCDKETTKLGAASTIEVQVGHKSVNATAVTIYIWRTLWFYGL
jgi:hypothetical protein